MSCRAIAVCACPAGGVPGLAAHVVERVGGPLGHVERVHAAHRVVAAGGHDITDPVGRVGADQANLGAALGSQLVEERLDRRLAATGLDPHQPARVVIDDHGQVVVALQMRDLVDADPGQAFQRVDAGAALGHHPGDDPPDRHPGDAQQLTDRRLRRLRRQPRRLVLEVAGEPRPVPRPRHRSHRHAMLRAVHPRGVGLQEDLDRAQVQTAPTAPTVSAVVARRRPFAAATTALPRPSGTHPHDHGLVIVCERDVLDHGAPVDTDQLLPYPGRAHAVSCASLPAFEQPET